jgi:hypothetical protein
VAIHSITGFITLYEFNQVLRIIKGAFNGGENELISVVKGLISHYS